MLGAVVGTCGSFLPVISAAECTDEIRAANYDRFVGQGGFRPLRCGDGAKFLGYWADSSCAQEQRGPKQALVIGGNTGSDCVGFLRLVSGDSRFSIGAWKEDVELELNHTFPRSVCPNIEYPLRKTLISDAEVLCVEPQQANARVMAKVASSRFWKSGFVPLKAAALDVIPKSGTVPFSTVGFHGVPNGSVQSTHFGQEVAHIFVPGNTSDPGLLLTDHVQATTVDKLVAEKLRGVPPLILAIDTEGFDGLVLNGARHTLSRFDGPGLIQFEYHNIGPWKHMHLQKTVASLDELGYECYWLQGPLIPLTCFDWAQFANRHGWSNVVCARRADSCWAAALEKDSETSNEQRVQFAKAAELSHAHAARAAEKRATAAPRDARPHLPEEGPPGDVRPRQSRLHQGGWGARAAAPRDGHPRAP
jgi:FkbM family methyltransferase